MDTDLHSERNLRSPQRQLIELRMEHADLDSLGQAVLGEALPMAALFSWLRGRAWADAPSQPRPDGQPGFVQLGWQIDLARWADGALDAVRLAPPAITVRARLEQAG